MMPWSAEIAQTPKAEKHLSHDRETDAKAVTRRYLNPSPPPLRFNYVVSTEFCYYKLFTLMIFVHLSRPHTIIYFFCPKKMTNRPFFSLKLQSAAL